MVMVSANALGLFSFDVGLLMSAPMSIRARTTSGLFARMATCSSVLPVASSRVCSHVHWCVSAEELLPHMA